MPRNAWLRNIAIVVGIAVIPVLAGEHGKKCTSTTQECLDHMSAKMKNSGWVGLELEPNEELGTLTVVKVVPGSPAAAAGIQPGDVLYSLNGVRMTEDNQEALAKARKEWKPGQSVTYTIKRNGADREVTLTLAPMPADVLAKWVGHHMLEHVSNEVAEAKK